MQAIKIEICAALGERVPRIAEVAAARALSVRNLQRILRRQDTSFRALVDETRRDRAIALILTELSADEIAARLSFSDVRAFTLAFKRWTGTTPRVYRRPRP